MEAYIKELSGLLTAHAKPADVTDEDSLKAFLDKAPEHLQAWAAANIDKVLEKKEEAKEAPAPAKPAPKPAAVKTTADSSEKTTCGEAVPINSPCLLEEWAKVRSDTDPQNWVIIGPPVGNASPKSGGKLMVEVIARGEDGMKGLLEVLDDSRVMFGGFRVRAVDERGGVTSDRSKFVHIQWTGSSMSAMAKAKITMQRPEFEKIFSGAHLTMQVSDVADITEEVVSAKLHANAGAHKPQRYEY
eukprot:NODE_5617_length_926_cov_27.506849_g5394_i0.p1 GENE.NODE_5617_length_926_cov_27.506849_g5394_i0~~NODE_5617_length_926_cov_27.506849_g5394_i0.p1  ORF type:complete len:244 (+),score=64.97 NODE_5617_length_926_cov_27.506849_g5394_i0:62-793(+)